MLDVDSDHALAIQWLQTTGIEPDYVSSRAGRSMQQRSLANRADPPHTQSFGQTHTYPSPATDSPISASTFIDLVFSCTCSEVGWDLCAASVRELSTASLRDVDDGSDAPKGA